MLRRITVKGVVQGVGFRPFVYRLATQSNLHGWVVNTSAGVDIAVEGDRPNLESFTRALSAEKPPLAYLDSIDVTDVSAGRLRYERFEIRDSITQAGAFQPISPDICICADCLRELFDSHDRRHRYPFINCTHCGPRFTIIAEMPYDRPSTTMAPFGMCDDCAAEYADPRNRRFHAQPIACPVCGPKVWLEYGSMFRAQTPALAHRDAVAETRALLAQGHIVAIKGLGGFHLACDASNANAVAELRRRKMRVDKPFALMLPDVAAVEAHCFVRDAERALLESRERPVVILRRRPESTVVQAVAPAQSTLGMMLPYTPLHYLLLERAAGFPDALVMTSGNLSEEPIATQNDEARERLAGLADAFLLHDRDIRTRCDDSVVRVFEAAVYPLRRSRGYAPFPVQLPFEAPPILATGAELKNTFALTQGRYAFLSQHIGDLENFETLRSFEQAVAHYEQLFHVRPQALAYDWHPDYLASRYALARAARESIPAIGVQHHHAHVAAVMAEHGLRGDEPVIGAAFDGAGFGADGAVWGGEFLLADYAGYQRVFHLDYVPLLGGDAAVREPARLALAWLARAGLDWADDLPPVRGQALEALAVFRRMLSVPHIVPQPLTSSMGRMFDAVAALIGIRQTVNYEAQAAIELEMQADADERGTYPLEYHGDVIDPRPLVRSIVDDYRAGVPAAVIAARFHNAVAHLTRDICYLMRERYGVETVVLSGGVWQNVTLLTRTLDLLRHDAFTVLVHRKVPANDGGLALGQAAIAAWRLNHRGGPNVSGCPWENR